MRKPADVKDQHGDRVGEPVLLVVLVDAGQGIKRSLERTEDRREERALAGENPGHVPAERLHEREHEQVKTRIWIQPLRVMTGLPQNRSGGAGRR